MMDSSEYVKTFADYVQFRPDRYGKATLFENEHLMVGLNCLAPGQVFERHAHKVQTRMYTPLEGSGKIWIGDEENDIEPGKVIWVPFGQPHRIVNTGEKPLILLVGVGPAHAD